MYRVIIDYRSRGGQRRAYGPDVWDFTVTIETAHKLEYSYTVFEHIARMNSVDWLNQPDHGWYTWMPKETTNVGPNSWRFTIERPYDD